MMIREFVIHWLEFDDTTKTKVFPVKTNVKDKEDGSNQSPSWIFSECWNGKARYWVIALHLGKKELSVVIY